MAEDIGNFLDNVASKNFANAEKEFSDMINARLADRLESHKAVIANSVYNGVDPEEVEDDIEDDVEVEDQPEQEEVEADEEL
jgi:hypothetical protein